MANLFYPKGKEQALALLCGVGTKPTGTLKAALIDTGVYVYNAAHDFFNDISGVVGTPVAISTPTFTNGVLDGADVTFPALSGNTAEAILIFFDTGTPTTSPLIVFMDTGIGGLPVQPNGGDVSITWNASGIAQL